MKNTVIYFSGTGNSLAVARLLAERLTEAEILPVYEMLRLSMYNLQSETCGIVFPVCCQDIPEIVRRLVSAIRLPASTYVYAVATHNGDVGYSHFTLDKILRKKGQRLQAGFEVLMPGNSITPKNSTNSEEEIERRIKAIPALVESIADNVLKRASLPYAGNNTLRKHSGMAICFATASSSKFQKVLGNRRLQPVPSLFTDMPENNIRVDAHRPTANTVKCASLHHWVPSTSHSEWRRNKTETISSSRYRYRRYAIGSKVISRNLYITEHNISRALA